MARAKTRTAARTTRTAYGPYKYASLTLLYARWLRLYAQPGPYRYVTLGGTELRDVESLAFVDQDLIQDARSYELSHERYARALASRDRLAAMQILVNIEQANLFTFKRQSATPHVFFIDIEGVFAWSDYHERLGDLLQEETIVEGDAFFLTSCLGRHSGWDKIYNGFATEYRTLDVSTPGEMQELYRWRHPTFTVYRAVECRGLTTEVCVECFGTVKYQERSRDQIRMPMGLWGYVVKTGSTDFKQLVGGSVPRFDMKRGFVPFVV